MLYEIFSDLGLGPMWSAVLAGYVIYVWGELYLTPCGERYLAAHS